MLVLGFIIVVYLANSDHKMHYAQLELSTVLEQAFSVFSITIV